MRLTRILPIILLLTACAPAAPVPTATPLPPTVTATVVPTSMSTMKPTATEAATSTPEPTSTSTVEPIPTSTPDSLPEGVRDLQTAIDTGWEWGDGEWGQHMVVEDGEIVFDKASLKMLGQEEFLKGFTYRVHPMDGTQFFPNFSSPIENPKPGFKWEWLHYEVKGLAENNVKGFLGALGKGKYSYNIAFETDNPEKNMNSRTVKASFIRI